MNSSTVSLLPTRACHAAVLAIVFGWTAAGAAAETADVITKSFPVSPGGQLVVDTRQGRIEVQGTGDSVVAVEIMRTVRASSQSREQEILAEEQPTLTASGNAVSILAPRGTRDSGWSIWWIFGRRNPQRDYRYTIRVPAQFNVELRASGGGITVARVTGSVSARTSGGRLEFASIQGDIDGRTSGGGITLSDCHGPASVHTSGGGIRATRGSGALRAETSGGGITVEDHRGEVRARTSGGGITVDQVTGMLDAGTSGGPVRATFATAPEADCRLHTSGGGITVSLPAGAAFTLDASTSGGGVRTDFPVPVQGELKRNRLTGPVNGGGPLLHLRTSGGGIRILREGVKP